jgi:hypothetical protein
MVARVGVARAPSLARARDDRKRSVRSRARVYARRRPHASSHGGNDYAAGVNVPGRRLVLLASRRARTIVARSTASALLTSQTASERARSSESVDATDGRLEPLFYREGEVWRSVVGRASRFSALWFGVLGAAQALFRVALTPTLPNLFESIADGVVLTLIVAPACAALASFAYECLCSFRLGMMAAFLPYTLSPYATKTPDERTRKALFARAMRNRGAHRAFARIKAARTYASEVCAEFATAAVEAPRRVVAVALALKAFSITNVSSVNATLDVMLLVTLVVAAVSANALERRRGQAKMIKEMLFVESEYLKAQTKGTFLCRWAPDPYEDPAVVNATSEDKALTNAAVADAVATSCELIGVEPETAMALVLDAADGRTSKVLMEKGVPKTSIWVPNLYTHVVHSLRKDVGVNGVATKVEAFLAARDPRETQLHAIYLDHCGSIDGRTQQLFDIFSRHTIVDGGIIAVTFSTRGKREGRGKAASVQLAAKALTEAAETHGYVLEGDAAPNVEGLADYTVAVRSGLGQTHAASSSQANAAERLRETADFVAEAMEKDNDGMIAASLALWARDSRPTTESEEALQTSKEKRQRRLAEDLSKRALDRLDADKPLFASDARALRSLAREVAASARLAADLRDPDASLSTASTDGERDTTTRSYRKCLYMYKTLMFFILRVRVARA